MVTHLKSVTGHQLDPLQSAYNVKRSVDDVVKPSLLSLISSPANYPSSINLLPSISGSPVSWQSCDWKTDRKHWCSPKDASPLLLALYANDCTSNEAAVKVLKFADDTTVNGIIQGKLWRPHLPTLQDKNFSRARKGAVNIIKDSMHPTHKLLYKLLLSWQCWKSNFSRKSQVGRTHASPFVEQPIGMASHWKAKWLAKVSHHLTELRGV